MQKLTRWACHLVRLRRLYGSAHEPYAADVDDHEKVNAHGIYRCGAAHGSKRSPELKSFSFYLLLLLYAILRVLKKG